MSQYSVKDIVAMLINDCNEAQTNLNPFLLYAKDCVGNVIFEHNFNKVLQYSDILDALIVEAAIPPKKPIAPKPYQEKAPERGSHGNSGVGTLKQLVGKSEDDTFEEADARKVGNMITDMEGEEKRDFVGIMNFMQASCTTYNLIHQRLTSDLKKVASRKSDFYKDIPLYLHRLGESQDYSSLNEANYNISMVESLSMKDQIKLAVLLLNEMSSNDVYKYITEAISSKTVAGARDRQDNGKGGLKAIVGKGKDEYLEPGDAVAISNAIKNEKDQDQKKLWLGYVSLLGAICPLSRAMKEAYRKKQSARAKRTLNKQTIDKINATR